MHVCSACACSRAMCELKTSIPHSRLGVAGMKFSKGMSNVGKLYNTLLEKGGYRRVMRVSRQKILTRVVMCTRRKNWKRPGMVFQGGF